MDSASPQSSLFADPEGNEVPSLGGGREFRLLGEEDCQSPLERLIAHSTANQRGDSFTAGSQRIWENSRPPPFQRLSASRRTPAPQSPLSETPLPQSSPWIFAVCGFCALSQAGLVWYSFLSSSSWVDTRLFRSLSSTDFSTNESELLHSEALGSLVGDLIGADQHWTAIGLVLTSLALPCLCFVAEVTWIVDDWNKQRKQQSLERRIRHEQSFFGRLSPRLIVEYIARVAFSIVFVLCILEMGTSPLTIDFEASRFVVMSQIQEGMASYTLGMLLGLSVLVILRCSRVATNGLFEPVHKLQRGPWPSRRGPTEYLWEVRSDELWTDCRHEHFGIENEPKSHCDELELLRTPLLQNNEWFQNGTESEKEALVIAMKETTNTIETDDNIVDRSPLEAVVLDRWKYLSLYTFLLLSTLLWIPTLCVPMFHLKYDGIASEHMSRKATSVRLIEFPIALWRKGVASGTNRWNLFVVSSISLQLILVYPMLANLTLIGAWMYDEQYSTFCRNILWTIQPLICNTIFAAAVLICLPAFQSVTRGIVEDFASPVCDHFQDTSQGVCLEIQGESSLGVWLLLVQSVSLELLVIVTMSFDVI